jgi:carbonic anhydrase/acetyltransferase-like protein (isoleucine patch superfamily)
METSYLEDGKTKIYLLDMWYLPRGFTPDITTIKIPSDSKEKGFYTVPDFMGNAQTNTGDLTHMLPSRSVLFIETWFHVYVASIIYGVFTRASRLDERIENENLLSLHLLWRGILEQKQILSTSSVVEVGRNTTIHPSAIITGPAKIGDNCSIGPGVIIDNCTIGDNVTINTGSVVTLSTIGDGCFLPFNSSLFMTAIMEHTIVAQNTCLQMCVIGRNSFIGAGNTFTDFNLIGQVDKRENGRILATVPRPIGAANGDTKIEDTGQTVLGGAVGHNCRLGAGMIIFPGRMIESDVVMFASPQRRVISRSVTFEESDHHYVKGGAEAHRRLYPRPGEMSQEELLETWEEDF